MKGRALRRALATNDSHRIGGDVPLITDTTELITPDRAYEILLKNKNNRPINWQKVEEYADKMRKGEWALHAQGIILDADDNLITGQKRLWAVIYSGVSVYMRVSRGTPKAAAGLIDRGQPQSSRDLAARASGRKHSPVESSLARGAWALQGILRPTVEQMASQIERLAPAASALLTAVAGTKKTKAVLMVLAVIVSDYPDRVSRLAHRVPAWADALESALAPQSAATCWSRGAAFGLAMDRAREIIAKEATA